ITVSLIQQAQRKSTSTWTFQKYRICKIAPLLKREVLRCYMGHHRLNGQICTCKAIIYDIVHDYHPFYMSYTKTGCRKKLIDRDDHYWCGNCNNSIPSPDVRYELIFFLPYYSFNTVIYELILIAIYFRYQLKARDSR
ncbi:hypothetical protein IFM89_006122, partial [Coptis chinensis]